MCGIVGYVGNRHAAPILRVSTEKLEYRGYDSCGIATLYENKIFIKKDVGRVGEANKKLNFDALPGKLGIMHVRWATHGVPSKINAHPHVS